MVLLVLLPAPYLLLVGAGSSPELCDAPVADAQTLLAGVAEEMTTSGVILSPTRECVAASLAAPSFPSERGIQCMLHDEDEVAAERALFVALAEECVRARTGRRDARMLVEGNLSRAYGERGWYR